MPAEIRRAALALAAAGAMQVPPAGAELAWYGGMAAGRSRTSDELVSNRESTIVAARAVRSEFDESGSAWKVFGGLKITSWLGVEVTYADLGRSTLRTSMLGGDPPLSAAVTMRRDIAAYGVDARVALPWRPAELEFFGKAGVYRTRLKADAALEGNIRFGDGDERYRALTRRETAAHYGIGVEWRASPHVAVRAEYERFRGIGKRFEVGGSGTTGEADTDVAWLAVIGHF